MKVVRKVRSADDAWKIRVSAVRRRERLVLVGLRVARRFDSEIDRGGVYPLWTPAGSVLSLVLEEDDEERIADWTRAEEEEVGWHSRRRNPPTLVP